MIINNKSRDWHLITNSGRGQKQFVRSVDRISSTSNHDLMSIAILNGYRFLYIRHAPHTFIKQSAQLFSAVFCHVHEYCTSIKPLRSQRHTRFNFCSDGDHWVYCACLLVTCPGVQSQFGTR